MARVKNTQHHRKPKSTGGMNDLENISFVTKKEHEAFHLLFGNKDPISIARILSKKWIDPEWRLVAHKKKKRAKRKKAAAEKNVAP